MLSTGMLGLCGEEVVYAAVLSPRGRRNGPTSNLKRMTVAATSPQPVASRWRRRATWRFPRHRPAAIAAVRYLDYLDGGAGARGSLYAENCRAFEDITFRRPRHAVAFRKCRIRRRVLRLLTLRRLALLSSCGLQPAGILDGEIGASAAAGKAGTGYILSTYFRPRDGK